MCDTGLLGVGGGVLEVGADLGDLELQVDRSEQKHEYPVATDPRAGDGSAVIDD